MNPVRLWSAVLGSVLVLSFAAGCHRTQTVQRGYRGLAMEERFSESYLRKEDALNKLVKPLPAAKTTGPTAAETYENVHVLGDLTKSQFARVMLSIKTWVAPDVGCNYCHAAPIYAADDLYTKRVARKMIEMTRHINTDWKQHVGATGVTCYTCHRGNPVPAKLWYSSPTSHDGLLQHRAELRPPEMTAANTTLPADALTDYLLNDQDIRVIGNSALQSGNRHSVWQAKDTYTLMLVMSDSLGVNCTFCHNTRAFASWELSTPQRVTAWYGIRMVRDLNNTVMLPLASELPPERLGPSGDVPKIYCATCHQGSNKPLYGAPMLKDYPELVRPAVATADTAAIPAAAATAASVVTVATMADATLDTQSK
jgi:photosynthetic reaction center cytochrome c subunit